MPTASRKRLLGFALLVAALAAGLGLLLRASDGNESPSAKSLIEERFGPDRGQKLPAEAPVAVVGGSAGLEVTRVHPATLVPTGRRTRLGEYHDTYSFSPRGSQIAFGISAPSEGGGGRIGIRLVDARSLAITGNISTGVYAAALAWLEPKRLVALLGDSFTSGPCVAPPCAPPTVEDPEHSTVVTVNPATGQVLERSQVPHSCGTSEVRGRALLSLAGRSLSIVGPDGAAQTVLLPPSFAGCGEIAKALGNKQAFVLAEGGREVAEIALESSELTIHHVPGSHPGGLEVIGLGDRRLLAAQHGSRGQPAGVSLIDTETQRRKTIDPSAGDVRVNGRMLLTFEGRRFLRGSGIGVRGYSVGGRRRFQVLRGEHVAKVEVAGRFAYAITRRGVAVIDTRSGSVVDRSPSPFRGNLLTKPSGP